MNHKKPVLSLCIPTYNRSEYLEKSLYSIFAQQPYLEGKVEIVISDNSDNDNTRTLIENIANNYSNIRYFRNEKNIRGINYAKTLSRGTGIYRKLVNDYTCFNPRNLTDVVYTIENYQNDRPVIVWKIYHRIRKEFVSTSSFEELMRTISYYSTWIGSYGIWEDEADSIVDDCLEAKNKFIDRFLYRNGNDVVAERIFPISVENTDFFWQLRYLQKSFSRRERAILVDSASYWKTYDPPKAYGKGMMKWLFYDYYMDIINEFKRSGLISQLCVDELERDIAFSFFVTYMVDVEFPFTGIKYDKDETLIEDILHEYSNKPYYEKLYSYYQERRLARIEQLKSMGKII